MRARWRLGLSVATVEAGSLAYALVWTRGPHEAPRVRVRARRGGLRRGTGGLRL